MRHADRYKELEDVIQRQLDAEAAFRTSAYRAWPLFPDHPAAPALAAFHRYLAGDSGDTEAFRGLTWTGILLEQHQADWTGFEAQLSGRLRSAQNFLSCVFELEVSHWLRSRGHTTKWLWPSAPEEGDILIDESLWADCIVAGTADKLRIPNRYGAQLASVLVGEMDRTLKNLHVDLTVLDVLTGTDVPVLQRAIRNAIRLGRIGEIQLPIDGFRVRITDLASGKHGLTEEEAICSLQRLTRIPHRWGHVKRDPISLSVHPQVVTMQAEMGDDVLTLAARTAASKHEQIREVRPSLVCVKFGLPVTHEQATNEIIQSRVRDVMIASLADHGSKAHRVSGVLWVFDTAILFQRAGLGVLDEEPGPKGYRQVITKIATPYASVPLPESFLNNL